MENSKGRVLEKYDLTTMASQVVWQVPDNVDTSWIAKIIPMENTLYVAIHEGDLTMGRETLYKIANGKGTELISCHQFGALEMSGDMIYYTSMENMIEYLNIGAYNQKTKKGIPIGTEGYVYDLEVDVRNGVNGEKTLVNAPVQKAELKNNCLYYTKKGTNHEVGEGLYIYGLTTGQTTTVSEKPIKDFKVSGKRIGYQAAGYAPGIYKWIDGKNTTLVEGIIKTIDIGEGSIGYRLEGQKENSFVKY